VSAHSKLEIASSYLLRVLLEALGVLNPITTQNIAQDLIVTTQKHSLASGTSAHKIKPRRTQTHHLHLQLQSQSQSQSQPP